MADREEAHWATGRRKTAVARVRLVPGEGTFQINQRSLEDYFGRETSRMVVNQPFEVSNSRNRFNVIAGLSGGGIAAQAEALRHGIARALLVADGSLRSSLKKAGFLTRDSREVERKKYGRHKARKRPQYSKR
ncbi:MAG: 30S ribosomal protein S9 [Candidatus Binatia bacterium]